MKLYVNFEIPKTPREFFIKFYSKDTANTYLQPLNTYHDEECKKLHCSTAFRSFDDIFDLLKTYYPELTEKDVINLILTTKMTCKLGQCSPHLSYCGTMERNRFIPYYNGLDFSEDLYLDKKMRLSKNTWRELVALLGLKTIKDVKDYYKKHAE